MNIYASSTAAAEKLLPEAIIGLAIVKEDGFAEDQYVSFSPDLSVASFDILSSPVTARLRIHAHETALTIAPDEQASIGQCVLTAIGAVVDDINDGGYTPSSPAQKPPKK